MIRKTNKTAESSHTVIVHCRSRLLWCIKKNLGKLIILFAFGMIPASRPSNVRKTTTDFIDPSETGMKRLVDCANATLAEIERLQKYSELVCDLGVALTFFDAIRGDVEDLQKILRLRARQDLEEEALLALAERELDEIVLPGFDVKRSKWQQLLHGDAPGAYLDPRLKSQYGKSQILSIPAYTSANAFLMEQKLVLLKFGMVSLE